jgi:hypothetical protein
MTIVSAAAAALIALSAAANVAPATGPPGYTYEGTFGTRPACFNRAVFLERNYGIQGYECNAASNDGSDTSTELWVKW